MAGLDIKKRNKDIVKAYIHTYEGEGEGYSQP